MGTWIWENSPRGIPIYHKNHHKPAYLLNMVINNLFFFVSKNPPAQFGTWTGKFLAIAFGASNAFLQEEGGKEIWIGGNSRGTLTRTELDAVARPTWKAEFLLVVFFFLKVVCGTSSPTDVFLKMTASALRLLHTELNKGSEVWNWISSQSEFTEDLGFWLGFIANYTG